MADLKHLDRRLLENLLGMGSGYVLDFSDVTYEVFFRDFGIDIEDFEFHKYGRSKAKRMRAFWELCSDEQVGKVLKGLFEYITAMNPSGAGGPVEDKHWAIAHRLRGTKPVNLNVAHSEKDFLALEFGKLDLAALCLAPAIEKTIRQRLDEIQACLVNDVPLAAVLLCGSTLEGLLLDVAVKNPQSFNAAKAAPKVDGKVRMFHDWSLNDFINVGHETGLIGLDVKSYAHALRDFRNYIHPFQQASSQFSPDRHTAKISWQVLQAAIADLSPKWKRLAHAGPRDQETLAGRPGNDMDGLE